MTNSMQFGITLQDLRKLMEYRGYEAVLKIEELGGVNGICQKLNTDPNDGTENLKKVIFVQSTYLF